MEKQLDNVSQLPGKISLYNCAWE